MSGGKNSKNVTFTRFLPHIGLHHTCRKYKKDGFFKKGFKKPNSKSNKKLNGHSSKNVSDHPKKIQVKLDKIGKKSC